MERITEALQEIVSTSTDLRLQKWLSSDDGLRLTTLLEREQRRWPNQDTSDSMEEYLGDFEKLALKYSLQQIEEALEILRIDPEQAFFPKPNEVAEIIEAERRKAGAKSLYRATLRHLEEMEQAGHEHYKFRLGWDKSGLSLADYCAKLDAEDNARPCAAAVHASEGKGAK